MSGRWFPRWSVDGRHLASGDTEIVVDGFAVAPGIGAAWINDRTVIWNGRDENPGVWAYQVGSGQPVPIRLSEQRFNRIVAGGGYWAGWRPDTGIIPSWNAPRQIGTLDLDTAGGPNEFDLSPSGIFVCADPYQGTIRTLFDAYTPVRTSPLGWIRASRNACLWLEQETEVWGFVRGGSGVQRFWTVQRGEGRTLIPIETPEGIWALVSTQGGYFVAPLGSSTGIVFDNGGQTYSPDAVWADDEQAIKVAFTNTTGEFPQDFPRHRLTDPRMPVPPVSFVVPPLGDRLFFYFGDDPAVDLPRNATTFNLEDGIGLVTADGRLIASFAGGGDRQQLEDRAWVARQQGAPVVGIADGFWPTIWPAAVDILATELYPFPRGSQEPAASIADRVQRQLATFDGSRRFLLVVKQYRNPGETYPREELPTILQAAVAIAAADHRVLGFGIFSGPARQGGVGDHPELVPLQRQVFAQISGRPSLVVHPPAQEPPPMKPYPGENEAAWIDEEVRKIEELEREVGVEIPRGRLLALGHRSGYDFGTLSREESLRKHYRELAQEYGVIPPQPPPSKRLDVRGAFFTVGGERWTAIEATDFDLLHHVLHGIDIRPVLDQRADVGFNLLRVLGMFDARMWGLNVWLRPQEHPDYDEALGRLLELLASYGLYAEFTVFADTQVVMPNEGEELAHWDRIGHALRPFTNRLVEAVNEDDQHKNHVTAIDQLTSLDGILCSRGSNGSDQVPPRPWIAYETYHTNDLSEWWRKGGHNGMELSEGADGIPASRVPVLANENTRSPDRDDNPAHYYDAAAAAALLIAGSCFHSVRGKTSELWDGRELECARAHVAGARSVPLEFQDGAYQRLPNDPGVLRTYRRVLSDGRYHEVRIRN